ncbi:uncharacterized protein LOC135373246 [Ornithodoros turicata]|uniref:uncharacterized protein LOC135373246 n=1 Tax=Ornithodoros turicata TaxID=34597 RepID=UPI003139CF62
MLAKALRPFSCMFTERPGLTHALEYRIETGDGRPWRCNPRPLSVHKRKLFDAALDEMIETGAVRPSRSPWAFSVVLAAKKDGTARLCVDYRRLNEVTEHLSHLKVVLGRMQAPGLTVNPRKMQLATNSIDLLGFKVESGTFRPNEDKLKAILEYPRPTDVKSLQRFLVSGAGNQRQHNIQEVYLPAAALSQATCRDKHCPQCTYFKAKDVQDFSRIFCLKPPDACSQASQLFVNPKKLPFHSPSNNWAVDHPILLAFPHAGVRWRTYLYPPTCKESFPFRVSMNWPSI